MAEWLKINDEGEIEFVSEEVKLVPEMKAILSLNYNKGKGDNEGRLKVRAKKEMMYLYLAYSPKSPYRDYSEEDKFTEAKTDCNFPEGWTESKELQALIPKFIRGNKNKIMRMLNTVERFLDKFEKHLNGINLDERTKGEALVHSPKDVMSTLEKLPRFAETLQELEIQARSGVITKNSSKGDHEVGWMNKDNKVIKKKEDGLEDEDRDN